MPKFVKKGHLVLSALRKVVAHSENAWVSAKAVTNYIKDHYPTQNFNESMVRSYLRVAVDLNVAREKGNRYGVRGMLSEVRMRRGRVSGSKQGKISRRRRSSGRSRRRISRSIGGSKRRRFTNVHFQINKRRNLTNIGKDSR